MATKTKKVANKGTARSSERFNLDTVKGRKQFNALGADELAKVYASCDFFDGYIKNKNESPLTLKNASIYVDDDNDNTIVVHKGGPVIVEYDLPRCASKGIGGGYTQEGTDYEEGGVGYYRHDEVSAVVIDCKTRHGKAKDNKALLLVDADDNNNTHVISSYIDNDEGHPFVSFECVGQMFKDRKDVIEMLAKGQLVLLDYTPDERIPFTANEKKLNSTIAGRKKLASPKIGFSQVGNSWHRSGSCLFQHVKSGTCYIFGQDEGTYFGCELPEPAKTVQEAFDVLTPKEVRGKPYQRQGEWFALPVEEKNVPATKDCVLQFTKGEENIGSYGDDPVFLPLDDEVSNKHHISTDDGRVGKDGQVYVKDAKITHDEHQTLVVEGWATFYRNTAVRSVSQEGVD
jgi:hypothetical protein